MKPELERPARLPVGLRVAALALGLAVAVLLLAAGLADDGGSLLPFFLVVMLLPAVLLATQVARTTGRPAIVFAAVPIASGLATVTWLVGRAWLPDEPAWWWPGALVSALPLCLLAVVPARHEA